MFQVVIDEHPGNVHGRYHVTVSFGVPERRTDSGSALVPVHTPFVGWVGAWDGLDMAMAQARHVQEQGVAASVLCLFNDRVPVMHLAAGPDYTACGIAVRPPVIVTGREHATCTECLLVRAG